MNIMEAIKQKREVVLKALVLIIILVIIFGIWIVKNQREDIKSQVNENTDFSLHIVDGIDLNKLKSYKIPIIIDFGSEKCSACKEMAPILKELNEELQGKAIIKFVDVWKYRGLADEYPIDVIPTQLFFDSNGKPYNPKDPKAMQMTLYTTKSTKEHVYTTHEGAMTKEELLKVLKEMGLE